MTSMKSLRAQWGSWAAMVLTSVLFACSPEAKDEEAKPAAATASTATPAVAIKNATPSVAPARDASLRTIEPTDAMIAQGKTLFAGCGACHGAEGEGRAGIGPRLNSDSFLVAASDRFLSQTIAEGRVGTTMIAWKAMYDDAKIDSLVAYIRSFSDAPPVELNESPMKGDANAGQATFAGICAGCHGRTGAGYQETANGTGIGRKVFLDTVTDGFLRYIIKHGKSDTPMRGFAEGSKVAVANLSDTDIENVIVFLRQNAW